MRTLRIIALLFVLGILFITGTVMNGAVSGRVYAQEGDGQSFVPGGTVPGDGEQQTEEHCQQQTTRPPREKTALPHVSLLIEKLYFILSEGPPLCKV